MAIDPEVKYLHHRIVHPLAFEEEENVRGSKYYFHKQYHKTQWKIYWVRFKRLIGIRRKI